MDITASIVASRLSAAQRALDVTAGNLANADTPGYRAARVQFTDWLSRQTSTTAPPGGNPIAYVQDRATWREQQQGPISHTGNPLDLALANDGYFTVTTPAGPRLTRDGHFGLKPDGTLADLAGNALLDIGGQPIQLSPADTTITIAGDGTVSSQNGQLGRIGVVQPADPLRLTPEGGTLYRADTPTSQVAAPGIVQGAVEDSNVQPVLEVTRMMDGLRQFQFVTSLMQMENDRQQAAIDKLLPASS